MIVLLVVAVVGGAVFVRSTLSAPRAPSFTCGVTVSPGVGVGVIAGDVVSAADGSTVCLAGGSYPSIHIEGAVHGS
ncbi:MAG TPA: hypothetical protein VK778_08075, partial [Solirubrobacteraceae bacterium]|nr:hypothetical protein [Solirubrobacteraceae bacterium]